MVTGLFVGKFLPPHKGHIFAIKEASKQCDKLYVVVGENPEYCMRLCEQANIPYIDLQLKTKWVKEELKDINNVEVLSYDERNLSHYPYTKTSWASWVDGLKKLIGDNIDIIFGSEPKDVSYYNKYFPNSEYKIQDADRKNIPIASTLIREDWCKYFDFIVDSAKPWFENLKKEL